MSKNFEVLEHTADIGIVSYGTDMKAVFAHAAEGMFSLMTDLSRVAETTSQDIEVSSTGIEDLLFDWLDELVYRFDVEHIIYKRFEMNELEEKRLKARAFGEPFDPSRHELKIGIKAVTYHQLKIERQGDDGYRAQVIFDI